jgi:uncharacterized membrane protein|tara:strand:- start:42901 stop:43314 length:414 start_codon:yes stop_codon:yes gene_type:complete
MSILYIIIGIKHFITTEIFVSIIPPFLPLKEEIVFISGLIEIILGLCLLSNKTRKIGALGIIFLLIAVFPANIYLYLSDTPRDILQITKQQALIRMPFQIPLIILSYWHSRETSTKSFSIACIVLYIPTILYFISIR